MCDVEQAIFDTVVRYFQAIDAGDWATVRALLTDAVDVAHGPHRTTLSAADLAARWQGSHARFRATRYRLRPLGVELIGESGATARFASHTTLVTSGKAEREALVIDGHYTVDLERVERGWNIRAIRHDESPGG